VGHFVQGLIAKQTCFQACSEVAPRSRVASLDQGFGLLLVTDAPDSRCNDPIPPKIAAVAQELSLRAPVAYIETEYFGGAGGQRAALWRDGAIIQVCETSDERGTEASTPLRDRPINTMLRAIGVEIGPHLDEFEAIGLDQFRSHEDWLATIHENTVGNG
jgi:hypothetical protein